jgi:hypothetical protein
MSQDHRLIVRARPIGNIYCGTCSWTDQMVPQDVRQHRLRARGSRPAPLDCSRAADGPIKFGGSSRAGAGLHARRAAHRRQKPRTVRAAVRARLATCPRPRPDAPRPSARCAAVDGALRSLRMCIDGSQPDSCRPRSTGHNQRRRVEPSLLAPPRLDCPSRRRRQNALPSSPFELRGDPAGEDPLRDLTRRQRVAARPRRACGAASAWRLSSAPCRRFPQSHPAECGP